MTTDKFYKEFANTSIDDRFQLLKMSESNPLTLQEIYNRVKEIDDKIRPDIIEQHKYLRMADEIYYKLKSL